MPDRFHQSSPGSGRYGVRRRALFCLAVSVSILQLGFLRASAGDRPRRPGARLLGDPPVHQANFILKKPDRAYRAGDSLIIKTVWDSTAREIRVSLRSILLADSVVRPRIEADTTRGTFFIRSLLPWDRTLYRPDGQSKKIYLTALNDSAATDSSLTIDLKNAPAPPVLDPVPRTTTLDYVVLSGEAPDSTTIFALRQPLALLLSAGPDPSTRRFHIAIPLLIGNNAVVAYAQYSSGHQSSRVPTDPSMMRRLPPLSLEPKLVSSSFPGGPADGTSPGFRNGETIRIITRWATGDSLRLADSLQITPDFSRVDQGATGSTSVFRDSTEHGVYEIFHEIPWTNLKADSSHITVPLTAVGPTGMANEHGLWVCLDNRPPEWIRSRIISPKTVPYRLGDSLRIETVWRSASGLRLRPVVDLSEIDSTRSVAESRIRRLSAGGDSIFIIRHRITIDSKQIKPDGQDKIITISMYNSGCGLSIDNSLRIDLDTTPPPDSLTLDPLPAATDQESLLVTGRARRAALVSVLRDLYAVISVPPDSSGRFQAKIGILPGVNKIQIRGEDAAGNTTSLVPPTPGMAVYRMSAAELLVAKPYSRREALGVPKDIILRDPVGMENAVLRIYNLEGDCLWSVEGGSGSLRELGFHWKGQDAKGNRAPQGYYLVRGEWNDPAGQRKSKTGGLLLKD